MGCYASRVPRDPHGCCVSQSLSNELGLWLVDVLSLRFWTVPGFKWMGVLLCFAWPQFMIYCLNTLGHSLSLGPEALSKESSGNLFYPVTHPP
jgi:hypothetical protein